MSIRWRFRVLTRERPASTACSSNMTTSVLFAFPLDELLIQPSTLLYFPNLKYRDLFLNRRQGAVKVMANDLIRTRYQVENFYKLKSQLQGVSLRIQRDAAVNPMLRYAESGLSTFDMADHLAMRREEDDQLPTEWSWTMEALVDTKQSCSLTFQMVVISLSNNTGETLALRHLEDMFGTPELMMSMQVTVLPLQTMLLSMLQNPHNMSNVVFLISLRSL